MEMQSKFKYHHGRLLESVNFGEVLPDPEHSNGDLKGAYLWLEKETGFYPLFVAVGKSIKELQMTGYWMNWQRKTREWYENGKNKSELRKAGEFPNYALFSFNDIEGVFMDYWEWENVLGASHKGYKMSEYEKRKIFKQSWPKSRWLRRAKTQASSVQMAVPALYLPNADGIWVRNNAAKEKLENMGFRNAEVKRISTILW